MENFKILVMGRGWQWEGTVESWSLNYAVVQVVSQIIDEVGYYYEFSEAKEIGDGTLSYWGEINIDFNRAVWVINGIQHSVEIDEFEYGEEDDFRVTVSPLARVASPT